MTRGEMRGRAMALEVVAKVVREMTITKSDFVATVMENGAQALRELLAEIDPPKQDSHDEKNTGQEGPEEAGKAG